MACVRHWRELVCHVGPDQPCYGIKPREHGGRIELFSTLEDLAACFVAEMRRAQPTGPYAIVGYSFSGYLALEMAQQLVAQREKVSLLAVIEAPGGPSETITLRNSLRAAYMWLSNLRWWVQYDLLTSGPHEILARARRKARWLIRRAAQKSPQNRDSNGADEAETIWDLDKLPESHRALIEANFEALNEYRPQVYPGSISLFIARARPLFHVYLEPDLGWRRIAGDGLKIHVIEGSHSSILAMPCVRTLAELIRRDLADQTPRDR
jgi:aspartate racemase